MATLSTHIPEEITDYKETIVFGLTLRQLVCTAIALIAGGLTFALCYIVFGLNAEQSSYFIMAAAILPAAVGFLRPQNMDFEKYVLMRYRHWIRSRPIPYKTSIRGDKRDVPVRTKSKNEECIVNYYVYDKRKERRIIKCARKHSRQACKETKKIQRAVRKAAKKEQRL